MSFQKQLAGTPPPHPHPRTLVGSFHFSLVSKRKGAYLTSNELLLEVRIWEARICPAQVVLVLFPKMGERPPTQIITAKLKQAIN